ncbi:unnamed protein product [Polarella glacialis]|uniref:Uncharacterized protein n=1 Tax=Polarella glacialis TaxID=89957 RepID=A0A813FPN9_POLGL|nr:unnamed protein product [Polarella glacialis]
MPARQAELALAFYENRPGVSMGDTSAIWSALLGSGFLLDQDQVGGGAREVQRQQAELREQLQQQELRELAAGQQEAGLQERVLGTHASAVLELVQRLAPNLTPLPSRLLPPAALRERGATCERAAERREAPEKDLLPDVFAQVCRVKPWLATMHPAAPAAPAATETPPPRLPQDRISSTGLGEATSHPMTPPAPRVLFPVSPARSEATGAEHGVQLRSGMGKARGLSAEPAPQETRVASFLRRSRGRPKAAPDPSECVFHASSGPADGSRFSPSLQDKTHSAQAPAPSKVKDTAGSRKRGRPSPQERFRQDNMAKGSSKGSGSPGIMFEEGTGCAQEATKVTVLVESKKFAGKRPAASRSRSPAQPRAQIGRASGTLGEELVTSLLSIPPAPKASLLSRIGIAQSLSADLARQEPRVASNGQSVPGRQRATPDPSEYASSGPVDGSRVSPIPQDKTHSAQAPQAPAPSKAKEAVGSRKGGRPSPQERLEQDKGAKGSSKGSWRLVRGLKEGAGCAQEDTKVVVPVEGKQFAGKRPAACRSRSPAPPRAQIGRASGTLGQEFVNSFLTIPTAPKASLRSRTGKAQGSSVEPARQEPRIASNGLSVPGRQRATPDPSEWVFHASSSPADGSRVSPSPQDKTHGAQEPAPSKAKEAAGSRKGGQPSPQERLEQDKGAKRSSKGGWRLVRGLEEGAGCAQEDTKVVVPVEGKQFAGQKASCLPQSQPSSNPTGKAQGSSVEPARQEPRIASNGLSVPGRQRATPDPSEWVFHASSSPADGSRVSPSPQDKTHGAQEPAPSKAKEAAGSRKGGQPSPQERLEQVSNLLDKRPAACRSRSPAPTRAQIGRASGTLGQEFVNSFLTIPTAPKASLRSRTGKAQGSSVEPARQEPRFASNGLSVPGRQRATLDPSEWVFHASSGPADGSRVSPSPQDKTHSAQAPAPSKVKDTAGSQKGGRPSPQERLEQDKGTKGSSKGSWRLVRGLEEGKGTGCAQEDTKVTASVEGKKLAGKRPVSSRTRSSAPPRAQIGRASGTPARELATSLPPTPLCPRAFSPSSPCRKSFLDHSEVPVRQKHRRARGLSAEPVRQEGLLPDVSANGGAKKKQSSVNAQDRAGSMGVALGKTKAQGGAGRGFHWGLPLSSARGGAGSTPQKLSCPGRAQADLGRAVPGEVGSEVGLAQFLSVLRSKSVTTPRSGLRTLPVLWQPRWGANCGEFGEVSTKGEGKGKLKGKKAACPNVHLDTRVAEDTAFTHCLKAGDARARVGAAQPLAAKLRGSIVLTSPLFASLSLSRVLFGLFTQEAKAALKKMRKESNGGSDASGFESASAEQWPYAPGAVQAAASADSFTGHPAHRHRA